MNLTYRQMTDVWRARFGDRRVDVAEIDEFYRTIYRKLKKRKRLLLTVDYKGPGIKRFAQIKEQFR